jgi:hypothetical protein
MLTRLHKDLVHGEYNLGLYQLADRPDSLHLFRERVELLAGLYRSHGEHLRQLLAHMQKRLDSAILSRLIGGFVRFHEEIYARPHTSHEGEYSV